MHPVHEGQFIGLAFFALVGIVGVIWNYIDNLKSNLEDAHEQAARAEEMVDHLNEEVHHLTADVDERDAKIKELKRQIADLDEYRSPCAYRENKKEWLDESTEHLRAETKDLDSEEMFDKCEGLLIGHLYWEDMFQWAYSAYLKAEHTLNNVGNILGDAGYPEKDELPF